MSYRPSVQQTVIGAGTDYTLTTSFARIDFGTTDPEVVLPTAGTYLLLAAVQFQASALSATDYHTAQFYNSTDSVALDLGNEVSLGASFFGTVKLTAILTVTARKTIQLWAANATAARGIVQAVTTRIRYVRLY